MPQAALDCCSVEDEISRVHNALLWTLGVCCYVCVCACILHPGHCTCMIGDCALFTSHGGPLPWPALLARHLGGWPWCLVLLPCLCAVFSCVFALVMHQLTRGVVTHAVIGMQAAATHVAVHGGQQD